jgi:hypothetical protein
LTKGAPVKAETRERRRQAEIDVRCGRGNKERCAVSGRRTKRQEETEGSVGHGKKGGEGARGKKRKGRKEGGRKGEELTNSIRVFRYCG